MVNYTYDCTTGKKCGKARHTKFSEWYVHLSLTLNSIVGYYVPGLSKCQRLISLHKAFEMFTHQTELLAFLNRDQFKHIVHLKMLLAYGTQIESHYITHRGSAGVLLLLPTAVSSYDKVTYPQTKYVVLMSADDPSVTQQMLDYVPTDCDLLFKFIAPQDRAVVETRFPLQRVTSFLSYTCPPTTPFNHAAEVIVSERINERLYPLYAQNGYMPDELQRHFSTGKALSFAIDVNGDPVSACLAYQNYKNIWEIGGVYTIPTARRKGYAKKLVESALHQLLTNGYMPRYQMHESNVASMRLAETVGLRRFLTVEHYGYSGER